MMKKNRLAATLILTLLMALPGAAQQLVVKSFKADATDISAVKFPVKDNNNKNCALVIVETTLKEATFGGDVIGTPEQKPGGEYWVYMPDGSIWLEVKAKGFLPAIIDISQTFTDGVQTNQTYRLRIITDDPSNKRSTYFNLGGGFNVASIMGPNISLGFNFGKHLVEVGAVIGMDKVENVSIYQKANSAYWGTYDYSASRYYLHYGYDLAAGPLLITPLVGGALTSVSGSEVKRGTAGVMFDKTYAVAATVGCRLSFRLGEAVRLQVTPEYGFAVTKDKAYEHIEAADSKIKSWTDGLNLSAGIVFHF